MHSGQLNFKSLMRLIEHAAVVVTPVGWALPAAIAYKTPVYVVAGGLLSYANSLRASAMHTDSGNADAAGDSTTTTSTLTYCQAVLWVKPLLAAIEKANNQLAGIREIEKGRQ